MGATKMPSSADNQLGSNEAATLVLDIFLDIISVIRGRRHGVSPTGIESFNIWLRQAIRDVQNDCHDHHAPHQLALVRNVTVGRVKQNLSEIYSAFNVCCEPELYMLLRMAYLLPRNNINKEQITKIVWLHIKGLD
jgi:hypothetical protein